MRVSDIDAVADVARIAQVLPIMEEQANKQIAAIENRVFGKLERGELKPDEALMSWMEVRAARLNVRSLKTRMAIGQTQGRKLEEA